MDKKHCSGCSDNFYNGNNPFNIEACWRFEKAEVEKKIMIGHWENPPYLNKRVIKKPNCYYERGNNKTHYVSPDRIDSKGYWK